MVTAARVERNWARGGAGGGGRRAGGRAGNFIFLSDCPLIFADADCKAKAQLERRPNVALNETNYVTLDEILRWITDWDAVG